MKNVDTAGALAPLRILIADDHTIFREGVKVMLRRVPGAEVVGEAADGFSVIRLARELHPDLVLLDIRMPRMNGLHAARRLKQENPSIKILALSAHDDAKTVQLLLHCGVSGYILKTDLVPEIVRAVETVRNGGVYLSSKLSTLKLNRVAPAPQTPNEAILNDTQRDILQMKRSGASLEEIASKTLLSVRTVQRHLRRIEMLEVTFGPNGYKPLDPHK